MDNNILFEDWDALIPEIPKLGTTQEPESKPLENSPAYIANMQWEENNLETWLEGSGGHPVMLDQCCGTVGEDGGVRWNELNSLDINGTDDLPTQTQVTQPADKSPAISQDVPIQLKGLQEQVKQLRLSIVDKLEQIERHVVETKGYIDELLPWTLEVHGVISDITDRIGEASSGR